MPCPNASASWMHVGKTWSVHRGTEKDGFGKRSSTHRKHLTWRVLAGANSTAGPCDRETKIKRYRIVQPLVGRIGGKPTAVSRKQSAKSTYCSIEVRNLLSPTFIRIAT